MQVKKLSEFTGIWSHDRFVRETTALKEVESDFLQKDFEVSYDSVCRSQNEDEV